LYFVKSSSAVVSRTQYFRNTRSYGSFVTRQNLYASAMRNRQFNVRRSETLTYPAIGYRVYANYNARLSYSKRNRSIFHRPIRRGGERSFRNDLYTTRPSKNIIIIRHQHSANSGNTCGVDPPSSSSSTATTTKTDRTRSRALAENFNNENSNDAPAGLQGAAYTNTIYIYIYICTLAFRVFACI